MLFHGWLFYWTFAAEWHPDVTMTTPTVYKPLPTPKTIRILQLEGARAADAPLVGRFTETDLNNPTHYNALSYTWDDEPLSVPLLVDGETVLIAPNCDLALRRLRKSGRVRAFWIDAVCINQADVQERNAQVSVMSEIYKKSDWVFVWLGEGTETGLKGWRRMEFLTLLEDHCRLLSMMPTIPPRPLYHIFRRIYQLYYAGMREPPS